MSKNSTKQSPIINIGDYFFERIEKIIFENLKNK